MLKCKKTSKEMMIMKKYSIKVLSAVFVFVFICSAFAGCDTAAEPDVISISSAGEIIADILRHRSAISENHIRKQALQTEKRKKADPCLLNFNGMQGIQMIICSE